MTQSEIESAIELSLYFDHSVNALRLTRNHMTREEAALRLAEAKPDLKTREVRYIEEGSDLSQNR